MKSYAVWMSFLLISLNIYCIFEEKEIFADASSMCGAVHSKLAVSSLYYNPACIFTNYKYNFYFANTKLFGIEELNNISLCTVLDYGKIGNFGLLYNIFSFEFYKEADIYFSYAKRMINKFNIGTSLKLFFLDIEQYGTETYFSSDLGFLVDITDNLTSGFVIKNFYTTFSHLEKTLIVTNKIKTFDNFFVYVDIIKSPIDSLFGELGYEWIIKLKDVAFNLRFGMETATQKKPAKYSLGISIHYDITNFFSLGFDYGYLVHNILGSQNLYSLGGYFIKNEEKSTAEFKVHKSTITSEKKSIKENLSYMSTLDLNTATEKELMQLPAIGKKFAKRIVEYRTRIGSFTCVEQLLNIPHFGVRRLEKIKLYVTINPQTNFELNISTQNCVIKNKEIFQTETCNINTATLKELLDIGFDVISAKNIIRYRKKFGKIKSYNQLFDIPNINLKDLEKFKEKIIFE